MGYRELSLPAPPTLMEPNSTQAVTPTSNTTSQPVKRLRRGDVREDGMVFWGYHPSCANGEWWMTPEQFAAKKAKEVKKQAELSAKKASLPTKLRCGDTREDGTVFWVYDSSCANGEWWLTPEQFAAKKAVLKAERAKKRANLSAKKAALPTKLRCGDAREDGKIFWCYDSGCVNGEYWMTPEEFAAKKAAEKARQAKKRADLSAKRDVLPTKLRRGDVREDGKIFWGYDSSCVNGEYWMTPEEFAAKKAKRNARKRERWATDPLFALKGRLSSRVSKALKRKGFKKNTKTAILLGCTYEDFKAYTEARLPPGMTWETFLSDGHLDHIVPLDAADTEADVYALNHYTNLRPMWGPDNIAKSDTLPEEHELPENLHPKVREIYLTAKNASAR